MTISFDPQEVANIALSNLSLQIYDESGEKLIESYNRYADIPKVVTLNEGKYTALFFNNQNSNQPNFYNPFYYSSESFTVLPNENSLVYFTSKLETKKINIQLSQDVVNLYEDVVIEISDEFGTLSFSTDEIRTGYFLGEEFYVNIIYKDQGFERFNVDTLRSISTEVINQLAIKRTGEDQNSMVLPEYQQKFMDIGDAQPVGSFSILPYAVKGMATEMLFTEDENVEYISYDFGNGAGLIVTSSLNDPLSYTYNAGGLYSVSLVIVNGYARDTLAAQQIEVLPAETLLSQDVVGDKKVFVEVDGTNNKVDEFIYNFGDGNIIISNNDTLTHHYVNHGNYNIDVSMKIDEQVLPLETKSIEITPDCQDELILLLAGGCDSEGKTWKLSVSEGAIGIGDEASESSDLYTSNSGYFIGNNVENRSFENSLASRFTFTATSEDQFTVAVNADYQINHWSLSDSEETVEFETLYSGPKVFNFNYTVDNGKDVISFTDNGYLAYYEEYNSLPIVNYEVVSISETELYLRYLIEYEGLVSYRYIKYVQEDVVEEVELDTPLEERSIDFPFNNNLNGTVGDEELSFQIKNIDGEFVLNPNNTQENVFSYGKNDNIIHYIYLQLNHRLDLSSRNSFSLDVYFPSTNDYQTIGLHEDWSDTDGSLDPVVSIKLGNSKKGESSWDTYAAVSQVVNQSDQWETITFTFSEFEVTDKSTGEVIYNDVSEATDYDQIIIQLGGEGHARPGTFFIKNFTYYESQ
ncbi:DUF4493 domain-containing protein [Flammeovirga sp. SubArs3]|uniref:DUF4493 domain-containing protein n=1 Tax=Flammeovirga sp. SubArs3 TaxID=2995316 RepID=UPI00248D058C|nr:DUF4493 domain-containing protein [Flammeovirga sp. SubArs3]